MTQLFILIITTSIWVLGLTIATQEGMVFYFVRDRLTDDNGNAIRRVYEPLIVCVWCMPSIHSIAGVLFSVALGWHQVGLNTLIMYPLVVMGSSLASGFVWQLIQLLIKSTEFINIQNSKHGSE